MIVVVDVMTFCLETELLFHPREILEKMLRSIHLGKREIDCLIPTYLHALNLIEDCVSVGFYLGLLIFLGLVIIFQELPHTKIDVALVFGNAIDD